MSAPVATPAAPRDFWRHCGYVLVERDASGRLLPTDDFLRAYLLRPELRPVDESCDAERALHRHLMDEPRAALEGLERLADADARDNYRIFADYRDRLLAAGSIEAFYGSVFGSGKVDVPPLFLDQLAQVVLRGLLEGEPDPFVLRAAELLYREQRATVQEGTVMLADLETVEFKAGGHELGNIGRLIAESRTPLRSVELDVMDAANAAQYWDRDERHDFVLPFGHGRPGAAALCRVLERWVRHFLGVEVRVQTVRAIEDRQWSWHVGLDADATSLLNDLWKGQEVEQGRLRRLVSLFRMEFARAADMRADIAGRPVYLALCMDEHDVVRMKPQNLLVNLPLAAAS